MDNDFIIRFCRICNTRNDIISFAIIKDTKSGKRYTHNICKPCRIEENHKSRLKRRKRNPKHDSKMAILWTKKNRNKWLKYRREWAKKRRRNWELYEYCFNK